MAEGEAGVGAEGGRTAGLRARWLHVPMCAREKADGTLLLHAWTMTNAEWDVLVYLGMDAFAV